MLYLAHGELAESPHDILSNILVQSAHQLTISDKFFIISYLLLHGVIKIVLISGLFLKKSWAYPASMIGLGGLMAYQLYRLIVVRYSLFLLILTLIDAVILWLIAREHKTRMHFNFFHSL
ncbi:MAG: hypothetical protein JWM92_362 [Candidatus Nomurabacteria bacterium]|nr:hypothetical protein [Candidatus Nomurabacteria bacterium]